MCGIVGMWRLDGQTPDHARLVAARDRLVRRGPDDEGLFIEESIGLGHRRLSIIDLSPAGRMPMSNETGTVWSVFNGEIYNFRELRSELQAKGHRFRSQTDSEVIVHAYDEWGTDSFARFDGMFALALWDKAARRLVLARDPAGEKPLFYWHEHGRGAAFGSTVRSLLAFPEIKAHIDHDALREYAEFGFVPAPRSIIEGIRKVQPGAFVVIDEDHGPVSRTYWSLADVTRQPARTLSIEEATDELHAVVRQAVRTRLISDVPLGAFLSGGVDSSLVVALMAEISASTVRTFTVGFREQAFDESEYAHRVAKHLGVENTTVVLSAADVLKELPAITDALDEPMADYSVLPSLAVARLARRHVTVALTGDGADEAFGGYRYYGGTRMFERIARVVPRSIRALVASKASVIPNARVARAMGRVHAEDAAAYFGHCGFYRGATAGGSIRRALLPREGWISGEDRVAAFVRNHDHLRPTEAGMLWDATHTLPDAWLVKVDRTSMAVGLEARAPLLQRGVLELAFRLPLDYRVRGSQKKIVLRRVLARYLPRELIERPKQGFTAPMRTWFANELREELHERLQPNHLERYGIFDVAGVKALLAEQTAGRADHTQLLWALLHLDRWREANI